MGKSNLQANVRSTLLHAEFFGSSSSSSDHVASTLWLAFVIFVFVSMGYTAWQRRRVGMRREGDKSVIEGRKGGEEGSTRYRQMIGRVYKGSNRGTNE
jgi:hypothetical protein